MEYTFRRRKISAEEFIIAIAVGCPLGANYLDYMNTLLSLSPKNENELWVHFCKILRRSEAPIIRSWRIGAHELYVSQFQDIEREFLRRFRYINDPNNSLKIAGYFDKLIKDNLMSRKEVDSAKSYLRQCGYFNNADDGDNSDSGSNSGASGQTAVSHDDVPGTSGHVESKEDNGAAAQNNLSQEEIQPIDMTKLSLERIWKIFAFLYTMTGFALADDNLIDKMSGLTTKDNDEPRNLKDNKDSVGGNFRPLLKYGIKSRKKIELISIDNILCALILKCPKLMSVFKYIRMVKDGSPKKFCRWHNICEVLYRNNKKIKCYEHYNAYRTFMDNVEFERELFYRIKFLNHSSNLPIIDEYIDYLLRKRQISDSVSTTTKKFLRLRVRHLSNNPGKYGKNEFFLGLESQLPHDTDPVAVITTILKAANLTEHEMKIIYNSRTGVLSALCRLFVE